LRAAQHTPVARSRESCEVEDIVFFLHECVRSFVSTPGDDDEDEDDDDNRNDDDDDFPAHSSGLDRS